MIIIVDYGMGNLSSIANMLKKAGTTAKISAEPQVIGGAEKLILPGVGAFESGMQNLAERGLIEPLNRAVCERRVPVLGLCLGMQLMTRGSEEGMAPGLSWIDALTVRFRVPADEPHLKVPHMGWNTVDWTRPSHLASEMAAEARFYFVHSYHLVCADEADIAGRTMYGYQFASAIERGNILGVQFHPEKSHRFGMQLLKQFADMAPPAFATERPDDVVIGR